MVKGPRMPEIYIIMYRLRYSLNSWETMRRQDKEPIDNIMGTFDVSILEISDGVFQVLSTGGNTRLG